MVLVSEAGKAISVIAIQRTPAATLMLDTPACRAISVREVQSLNAFCLILVTLVFSRFNTLANDEQFWKALSQMLVSEVGREISVREEQP